MEKFLFAASVAAIFTAPSVAMASEAPTAEQCKAWLEKDDVNKDGDLGKNEGSKKYGDMITGAGHEGMSEDKVLKGQMFLDECAKGAFGMPS